MRVSFIRGTSGVRPSAVSGIGQRDLGLMAGAVGAEADGGPWCPWAPRGRPWKGPSHGGPEAGLGDWGSTAEGGGFGDGPPCPMLLVQTCVLLTLRGSVVLPPGCR